MRSASNSIRTPHYGPDLNSTHAILGGKRQGWMGRVGVDPPSLAPSERRPFWVINFVYDDLDERNKSRGLKNGALRYPYCSVWDLAAGCVIGCRKMSLLPHHLPRPPPFPSSLFVYDDLGERNKIKGPKVGHCGTPRCSMGFRWYPPSPLPHPTPYIRFETKDETKFRQKRKENI